MLDRPEPLGRASRDEQCHCCDSWAEDVEEGHGWNKIDRGPRYFKCCYYLKPCREELSSQIFCGLLTMKVPLAQTVGLMALCFDDFEERNEVS